MDASPEILPAVSVALVRDDKVLLVKRGRPPIQGVYAFPGGRVEPGESFEEAACREMKEETGLDIDGLRFIVEVLTEAEAETAMPACRLRVFAAASGQGILAAADDAAEADFYTLEELNDLPLSDQVYEIARDLLTGR